MIGVSVSPESMIILLIESIFFEPPCRSRWANENRLLINNVMMIYDSGGLLKFSHI